MSIIVVCVEPRLIWLTNTKSAWYNGGDMRTLLLCVVCILSTCAFAENDKKKHSVPRFASIRSTEVNSRTGPGMQYPIEWVYTKKHEPVEIISEFELWRQIKDVYGDTGWVHTSVLSGKRYVIVSPDVKNVSTKNKKNVKKSKDIFDDVPATDSADSILQVETAEIINMYKSADKNSKVVAYLTPNLRCKFSKCQQELCKVECQNITGWVPKKYIWGILNAD